MKPKRKSGNTEVILCRDCAHAYDPHELDYKHEPFLCKCPFFQWSRFLNRDTCDKAIMK